MSELEEVVQGLAERVAKTEDGIANARKRLTGTFARKGEYEDMRATLNQLIADVRARIKTAQAELATLRAVPIASPDIKRRVEQYVNTLGRPKVAGIGKDETLRVTWPGDGHMLPMMLAFFHRDAMVEALLREIESVADDPLPLAERKKRIAELEVEIEVLQRQAFALGAPTTDLPPHVVLGVKLREHALIERKRIEQREHAA